MKRILLILTCVFLSCIGGFSPSILRAQDDGDYQPDCGNDRKGNPNCKKNSCSTDDANGGHAGGSGSQDPDADPGADDDASDCDDTGANPIDPHRANHHRDVTDIATFGPAPISFARNLNSRTADFTDAYWELGYKQGWQHNWNYEMRNQGTVAHPYILVRYPDGSPYDFYPPGYPNNGPVTVGTQFVSTADNGDRLYVTALSSQGAVSACTILTVSGEELDFSRSTAPAFHLAQKRNGLGYSWTCTYSSSSSSGRLTRITNNFGRWVQINRETGTDGVVRIQQVSTSDGRVVSYNYSTWTGSGHFVLSGANYPGAEHATYAYVTSNPADATARPLLADATDPAYARGKPGARMKYVYNYNAIYPDSFGLVTGTLLEERNNVTDQTIISFPLGSGTYPKVREGNGTLLVRKYTNGLLTTKGDGEGRATVFTRESNGFGFVNSKTDANGALTQYERDYAGRVLTRTDALGHARSRSYNAKGFLLTKTDELGHEVAWTRDTVNSRPLRKDHPDGSFETWTYDANSQPLTHGLRNGGGESFIYDSLGNMTSKTDALGNVTNYTYHPNGLLASVTDARQKTASYTYNWRGQMLTITYPDNSMVTYEYDTLGNRTSVTDELGHATAYTFDEYNRVKTEADPLGRTTTYEYGRAPGCNSCSYANTISRITSPGGLVTTYDHDASGLRTCQTAGAGTADAAITTYAYDNARNLITMTDPRGKIWHYTYDDKKRKTSATDPLGNITQWSYDDRGNKLSETRPDSGVTQFVYDNRNRLTHTTDPAGHSALMTYDNADNLLILEDARNNIYAFGYDLLNRKTSFTYPDSSAETYAYDAVGNLAGYTTRAGQVKTSAYDDRNRETSFTWSDDTPGVDKTYDAVGRTLTMIGGVSTLSYTYDEANQLLSETQQIMDNAAPLSVLYSYDLDGRRRTVFYPSGDAITYDYTGRGQLSQIRDGTEEVFLVGPPLTVYSYDLNDNRITRTLENGVQTDYDQDDANRLLAADHFLPHGTSVARFDYAYDSMGNRTSRQATVNNQRSIDVYGYDATDQLTQVKYNFDTLGNTQDRLVSYDYDPSGNRNSVADNGAITDYKTNNLNQYTGAGGDSPQYDANGNLSAQGDWSYTYDAQNRLVSATQAGWSFTFDYDARNRCVLRTSHLIHHPYVAKNYYYDGWNLIEEHASWNFLEKRYVHGARIDELVRRTDANGVLYYHQDALGSTVALTDSNGNTVERYSYDVFGAPAFYDALNTPLLASNYQNRFLFTSREYLADLGLYDYRNRFYSPAIGRFLQTDPLRLNSDANLYRYAGNNVLSNLDPFGLYSCEDLCEMVSSAQSGLEGRQDQLDALGDGDTNRWWDIEKDQVPIGHMGADTGYNPAIDAWESTWGSIANAIRWSPSAFAFLRNPGEHMYERSMWELERQELAAEWAAEQIEEMNCNCYCE